jgi:hypothetical protein
MSQKCVFIQGRILSRQLPLCFLLLSQLHLPLMFRFRPALMLVNSC